MKCLVTGCAGFIGSHLSEALIKKGNIVYGIDNFHPYYDKTIKLENISELKKEPNFFFIEKDILSKSLSEETPSDIDVVFHLAAIAGVRYSVKHPTDYFEINTFGTQKLLELFKSSKFVFTSSSSIYGNVPKEELPVKETYEPKPISPYSLSI